MKYIAIFDIPDDFVIGCAIAKVAPKGKDYYEDKDFRNEYAEIEPLSAEKAEIFDRFNAVERIISDLGLSNAYDMPSFWCNNKTDYRVIPTKYNNGYMQALNDVEKEVRLRFGFAERDHVMTAPLHDWDVRMDGET